MDGADVEPDRRHHSQQNAIAFKMAARGLCADGRPAGARSRHLRIYDLGARRDDIAKRAGVAKGTIYLYVPNKDALFKEMVRSTTVAAIALAEADARASESESAESQLRRLAANKWRFLRTERVQVLNRLVTA